MSTTAQFTPGDRIQVITCTDFDPLPAGATGTVRHWNPRTQQLYVDWHAPHTHRRLMLVIAPEADTVRLI